MRLFEKAIFVGLMLATIVGQSHHATPPGETAVPPSPPIAAALIKRGVDGFERAGLDLPPLDFVIDPSGHECSGGSGSFVKAPEVWLIRICEVTPFVIRHELAHAWAEANISTQDELEYASHWGFDSWHDEKTPWGRRGSEDAANVVAWALDPRPIGSYIANGPIADRAAAFEMLTGSPAPRLVNADVREPQTFRWSL